MSWLPGLDAWLVTRHEDVRRLFSDPRVTADPRIHQSYKAPADPRAARWLSEMPFRSMTPDGQSLGRQLVSAALTPRAVARLESCVAEVVEEFAAPLRARVDRVDLIGEFTVPVSATAIGRILGVPPKDKDESRFRRLAVLSTETIRPFLSEKKRHRAEGAAAEMGDYILVLATERLASPQGDLISDLLKASNGHTSTTVEDVTRVVGGLVSAGTGTTSVACGRALRTLLQHPDQLSLLRRDRSVLPNAVEELLRYDSGLIVFPRYALEDFDVRGRALHKGQLVLLSIMGANRDPRVFPEPDSLDLRRDTREVLTFGHGTHYCIGANIARMELRLMIGAALDFIPPGARLVEDEIRWSEKGVMSQIKSLPVDFASQNCEPTRERGRASDPASDPQVLPRIGAFDDPESYLRNRRGQVGLRWLKERAERRALSGCLDDIGPLEWVCDCPSGPGRLLPYWHERGLGVICVDASEPMVAASRARLAELGARGTAIHARALELETHVTPRPDLIASVRFFYYFDHATRLALLRSFAAVSRRFVLVQYKTNETLKGRRNLERETDGRPYLSRREIEGEIGGAGLRVRTVRFIGTFSDRVFVLAEKIEPAAMA